MQLVGKGTPPMTLSRGHTTPCLSLTGKQSEACRCISDRSLLVVRTAADVHLLLGYGNMPVACFGRTPNLLYSVIEGLDQVADLLKCL
jgi:hypothetical protein